jgi:hypothetical protein
MGPRGVRVFSRPYETLRTFVRFDPTLRAITSSPSQRSLQTHTEIFLYGTKQVKGFQLQNARKSPPSILLYRFNARFSSPTSGENNSCNGFSLTECLQKEGILLANSKPLSFRSLIFSPAQERLD